MNVMTKWLRNCSYNPHKNMLENNLKILSENLHLLTSSYGKIILLGDFIVGMEDQKNEILRKLQFEKSDKTVSMLKQTQTI